MLLSISLRPECLKERQERRQLTRIIGREETNLSRQFRVGRFLQIIREYFIDSRRFVNSLFLFLSLSFFLSHLVSLYMSSRETARKEEMRGEQHRSKLRPLS